MPQPLAPKFDEELNRALIHFSQAKADDKPGLADEIYNDIFPMDSYVSASMILGAKESDDPDVKEGLRILESFMIELDSTWWEEVNSYLESTSTE